MPRTTLPTIKRRRLPSGRIQFYANVHNRTLGLGTDRQQARRRLAELVLHGDAGRLREDAPPYLVRDLAADYLEWSARNHPRESDRYALLHALVPMFGDLPAERFGPVALEKLRRSMIDAVRAPRKRARASDAEPVRVLSRGTINHRVQRIRFAFRWAASRELIPPSVVHGLDALPGLRRGQTDARESEPVRPVSEAEINATCAHLRPSLRSMVWLQFWSGMRPGELLSMTGAQLDRSGPVWLYKPAEHKTNYLGRTRVVAIGPKAQEFLRPYLQLDPQARIFTPAIAERERHQEQRAARRSKVTPSQHRRDQCRQRRPGVVLGDCWDTHAYARAIARACVAAKVAVWSPNQLRHAAATRLRREVGLEAARVVLGHARAAVTEVYADLDHKAAADLMGRLG